MSVSSTVLFILLLLPGTWDYGLTFPLDGRLWVLSEVNPVFKAVGKLFTASFVFLLLNAVDDAVDCALCLPSNASPNACSFTSRWQ